jgi:carbon-monoxide dehydrogenase small subunit
MSADRPAAQEHRMEIALTINGRPIKRQVSTTLRLLHFLRDELRMTGAKEVCAEGECGACTVLLNGRAVNSCLILTVEAAGSEVVTIEGLEHPVQAEMMKTHALQCGYCFPGMVVSAAELIDKGAGLDREAIKAGLAGNLCRCTGYAKIIDAVAKAARTEEGEQL